MGRPAAGKNIDPATKDRIAQLLALDIPALVIAKRLNLSDSTIRKYKRKWQS